MSEAKAAMRDINCSRLFSFLVTLEYTLQEGDRWVTTSAQARASSDHWSLTSQEPGRALGEESVFQRPSLAIKGPRNASF